MKAEKYQTLKTCYSIYSCKAQRRSRSDICNILTQAGTSSHKAAWRKIKPVWIDDFLDLAEARIALRSFSDTEYVYIQCPRQLEIFV